jgi:TonB family protein
VIPSEQRQLFGLRIEERYEQRLVCVLQVKATASREPVLVNDPGEILIQSTQESIALPDDVARTCDPDVRLPIPTRDVKPQYNADALRAKIRGSVVLQGIVDRTGSVRDVRVVQSLEPSLDSAARTAFTQWEFRPATRGGEPIAIVISVQMAFTTR